MRALYIIKARYPRDAQIKCLRKVIEAGVFVKDKSGDTVKEILNAFISIKNPLVRDKDIKDAAELKMIKWMRNNFFNYTALSNWGYSYGQRLFNYNKIDQVKMVIKRLRDNHAAKSATITLMMPGFDDKHTPCLTTIDFKVRERKLVLTCFARSQDVYKKMYADILCLAKIQKKVASQLKVGIGILCIHVVSAHIYKEDLKGAKEFIKGDR